MHSFSVLPAPYIPVYLSVKVFGWHQMHHFASTERLLTAPGLVVKTTNWTTVGGAKIKSALWIFGKMECNSIFFSVSLVISFFHISTA